MIHAYDEYYLDIAQNKLALMFEIAVYQEKMNIDDFSKKFIESEICQRLEKADPIYLAGKSAYELLELILKKNIEGKELNMAASPEYWVGWVLAYTQWYTCKSFKEIITSYPCSKLLLNYFPYHEMDIMNAVNLIKNHLPLEPTLKLLRKKRQLSQDELSKISGVPLRTIRAYEQRKLDISKAQGETLYNLARTLDCNMEDLIK